MSRDTDIALALRSLDAAQPHVDATGPRARQDLDRILADAMAHRPTTAASPGAGPSTRSARSGRSGRRGLALTGLLAATTAGVLVLPSLTGGGDPAFASWTADPGDLSAQQRVTAGENCRSEQMEGFGAGYADDLDAAELAIAEKRGVWVTVILAGPGGFSALCISDDSAGLFSDAMIGSIGTPTDYVAPTPRGLVTTDLGTGTIGSGDISLAAGRAGTDVVDIVYPSTSLGDVAATVSQGRFALWLPGDELEDAPNRGVDVQVTYRDGTTGTTRLTL